VPKGAGSYCSPRLTWPIFAQKIDSRYRRKSRSARVVRQTYGHLWKPSGKPMQN